MLRRLALLLAAATLFSACSSPPAPPQPVAEGPEPVAEAPEPVEEPPMAAGLSPAESQQVREKGLFTTTMDGKRLYLYAADQTEQVQEGESYCESGTLKRYPFRFAEGTITETPGTSGRVGVKGNMLQTSFYDRDGLMGGGWIVHSWALQDGTFVEVKTERPQ